MKKSSSIVYACLFGLIISLVLYVGCKKSNSSNSRFTNTSNSENKRLSAITLYSKDAETNVIYQLIITKNADNDVTLNRTIVPYNPDLKNTSTFYGFDDEVNHTISPENNITINSPTTGNMYLIPFKPDHEIENYLEGGETATTIEFNCTCALAISTSASCQADLTKSKDGTITAKCIAKNCQTCKLHAKRVTKKKSNGSSNIIDLNTDDGFIVINANALNEI